MIEVGMMVTHDSAQSAVNEHRAERFGPVGLVVSVGPSNYKTALQSVIIQVIWCKEGTPRTTSTRVIRVISQ